jgi:hypothetical protein
VYKICSLKYVRELIISDARLTNFTAQEYVKLPPRPFLLYIANNDAIPEALDVRIRLALFLQGSNLYNPRTVREKLQASSISEIFSYERAIIDGKVCTKL